MIYAFGELAQARRKLESAEFLSLSAMASRGEPKKVSEMHKELIK